MYLATKSKYASFHRSLANQLTFKTTRLHHLCTDVKEQEKAFRIASNVWTKPSSPQFVNAYVGTSVLTGFRRSLLLNAGHVEGKSIFKAGCFGFPCFLLISFLFFYTCMKLIL